MPRMFPWEFFIDNIYINPLFQFYFKFHAFILILRSVSTASPASIQKAVNLRIKTHSGSMRLMLFKNQTSIDFVLWTSNLLFEFVFNSLSDLNSLSSWTFELEFTTASCQLRVEYCERKECNGFSDPVKLNKSKQLLVNFNKWRQASDYPIIIWDWQTDFRKGIVDSRDKLFQIVSCLEHKMRMNRWKTFLEPLSIRLD